MNELLDYIFFKASERIDKRYKEKKINNGLTYEDVCPSDHKLLSPITNYHTKDKKSREKYLSNKNITNLIPDRALINYLDSSVENKRKSKSNEKIDLSYYEKGIVKALGFKSKNEALWGTESEIKNNLHDIFIRLFNILENDKTNNFDIEICLSDYVEYAKYRAYYELLFKPTKTNLPFIYYGMSEDVLMSNIDNAKNNAIEFLYKKIEKDFSINFLTFCNTIDTFHNIKKVLNEVLYKNIFKKILIENMPKEESLGMRVRNIILSDFYNIPTQIAKYNLNGTIDQILQYLNRASSEYCLALEKIQKNKSL